MIQINWQPSTKDLRVFAAGQIVMIAIVAAGFVRRGGATELAIAVTTASAIIGLIGLIQPSRVRWYYLGWMIAVFPIGWCVFKLLLTLVFIFAIIPLGFLLKCLGIDPLARRFDRNCPTYWTPRKPIPPNRSYFRQF